MKYLISLILLSVVIFSFAVIGDFDCDGDFFKDIFMLGSVKSSGSDDIKELQEDAAEYEDLLDEKVDAAHRLGLIYQKLGNRHLERKAWVAAVDSYEKAIGYGNEAPIIHYSLGIAYANQGEATMNSRDIKKAEYHYRKAAKMKPDYIDPKYGLSILLFYVKKEKDEAFRIMREIVSENSQYYSARFALARYYYERKNPQKALSLYESLYSDLQKTNRSLLIEKYETLLGRPTSERIL